MSLDRCWKVISYKFSYIWGLAFACPFLECSRVYLAKLKVGCRFEQEGELFSRCLYSAIHSELKYTHILISEIVNSAPLHSRILYRKRGKRLGSTFNVREKRKFRQPIYALIIEPISQ